MATYVPNQEVALPPATMVLRDEFCEYATERTIMLSKPPDTSQFPELINTMIGEDTDPTPRTPSFARMTATHSHKGLKTSATIPRPESSARLRHTASLTSAHAAEEPGPGEYISLSTLDTTQGSMRTRLAGAHNYLGFGFKNADASLGDYNVGPISTLEHSGVSRFSTSCRDVLPSIEKRAIYSVGGLQTTVHYTLAPKPHLTKHTSMSRTRDAERKEPELLRTSSRGAKDAPSTPKGQGLRKAEMAGIGEGDVAPLHDPTGLSAMIRKMVADHQADYARGAKELAKYERPDDVYPMTARDPFGI